MSPKLLVWIGVFIGSTVGGYIPTLWGAELLSFSGVLGSVIGGLLGIWGAYKLSQRL
ncbi:MAG TPA: hypothetical protein VFD58_33115 [Blastocatellia bacterium]|nr:hypothetical protein [Blastocatellia bacterium]